MKLLGALFALFVGAVTPLAIMPSPQGTHWYAGETIIIRVVSNSDSDGTAFNLYLKEGNVKQQVYYGGQYNVPVSFVVPAAFNTNGCGTLYAVAQGSPSTYDTMKVQIMTLYDYNQFYNGDSSFNKYGYDAPYINDNPAYDYNLGGYSGGCGSGGCGGSSGCSGCQI